MGAERRSHFVTEDAKKATAYHEGGHALVALHTAGADPLHKVTIMPRGRALGITFLLPEMDKGEFALSSPSLAPDHRLAQSQGVPGHD